MEYIANQKVPQGLKISLKLIHNSTVKPWQFYSLSLSLNPSLLFFEIFMYLFEMKDYREEREIDLHPLVHYSIGRHGQGWARLKP